MIATVIPVSTVARATFGTKEVSDNRKIGPVFATYRAIGYNWTCPSACPMVKADASSCYANDHKVGMHQRRARGEQVDVAAYVGAIKPRADGKRRGVRHLVSGDLFWKGELDIDYVTAMNAGHNANAATYGWGYTHGWRGMTAATVNQSDNLTINASCESDASIKEAHALGWAAVTIVDEHAPAGVTDAGAYAVLTCPQQTGRATCDTCQLCAVGPDNRRRTWRGKPLVIGFRVHGNVTNVKRVVDTMWLKSEES